MTLRFIVQRNHSSRANVTLANLYVRIKDGRPIDQTKKTEILVNPKWWDCRMGRLKPRASCSVSDRIMITEAVLSLGSFIASRYLSDKVSSKIGKTWLSDAMAIYYNRTADPRTAEFGPTFEEFLRHKQISKSRVKQYQVLKRNVLRYESYIRLTQGCKDSWHLDMRTLEPDFLDSLWSFLRDEHEISRMYPNLYMEGDRRILPGRRSANTLSDLFKKLRVFVNWCCREGYMAASPFVNFHRESELYGTPVCLSLGEMHLLAEMDLSGTPALDRQRDVFVFQCNTGCRVGDLVKLKKSDMTDNTISFIPTKTIGERPRTVTVPLNAIAVGMVEKYSSTPGDNLLPFVSPQHYNAAIKRLLRIAGITRNVSVLDPLTRMEKKVPICDIASSHLARRTFINAIYHKVTDPTLVSSLTGHVEGSKAFSRYRDIDEPMKRDLVKMLE